MILVLFGILESVKLLPYTSLLSAMGEMASICYLITITERLYFCILALDNQERLICHKTNQTLELLRYHA